MAGNLAQGRYPLQAPELAERIDHAYVNPGQVLELVARTALGEQEQRKLRATIRRWVKTLRDAGHSIPEE